MIGGTRFNVEQKQFIECDETLSMKPTGKDGFGLYWQLKADEFRNGKYNYIVHKGDSKDCARDSVWFNTQAKQVFINQGDCTAYFSVEDAIKARK